jgi:hypothetical protein
MCAAAGALQAAPMLRCKLDAPARVAVGEPVPLRFTFTNAGATGLQLLRWNTPLEGDWFAPFVQVLRDGQPLPYRGPMVKRGDPANDQYLWLGSGASKTAELDLRRVFDLSKPGRYRVLPRIRLVDVFDAPQQAQGPRPREVHIAADVDCAGVDLTIV